MDRHVEALVVKIDEALLVRAVDAQIRPILIAQGQLYDPAKEGFHHKLLLPRAGPMLARESLQADPQKAVLGALRLHVTLLSRFELQSARAFVLQSSPKELAEHTLALLYGTRPLVERVRTYFAWSEPKALPDGRTIGIKHTVISYLLACSAPGIYAFCKPMVYNRAVEALLGKDLVETDPVQRIQHCTDFYAAALPVLQSQPGLEEFRDLMHTHIAFYVMDTSWSTLNNSPGAKRGPMNQPLNLILHGPPGTGKTYHTVRQAVETCLGEAPVERAELMACFKELRSSGHIEFVTFHQSFSYEEFVEGIRPVLTDPDGEDASELRYKHEKGIFRKICEEAQKPAAVVSQSIEVDLSRQRVWKMSLGDSTDPRFADLAEECIRTNQIRLGWGHPLDFTGCDDRAAVVARLQEGQQAGEYAIRAVDSFKNVMKVGDLVVVPQGNRKFRAIARVTGEYQHGEGEHDQIRPVEWLWIADEAYPSDTIVQTTFSQMTLYQLRPPTLKVEALQQLLTKEDAQAPTRFVLIIDEINRGNISKIFGELITLIEDDKRIGAPNEMTVRLPYSKEEFGVPLNLHILGTMNTSDRSIAFLDTALRRRFRFREMMPDPAVIRAHVGVDGRVEGIDVAELMQTLNSRIELLYDRDHQIGHAYFIGVKSLADLRDVFQAQIIPLLQEYFYDDWSKICHILACPYDPETGQKRFSNNPVPLIQAQSLLGSLATRHDVEPRLRYSLNPTLMQPSAPLEACFAAVLGPVSE